MSTIGKRHLGTERQTKRRSPLADLGDRIARGRNQQDDYEPQFDQDDVLPRYPIVRQGYDCTAVDEHIAELERELADVDRELAELRGRPSGGEVQAEIHRIGEQTSTILMAAHEQAQETTRAAQTEADRCVADAAANALAITEDANRQLRELETEKDGLSRQREFLVRDIRGIASALTTLADDANGRFPGDDGATEPIDAPSDGGTAGPSRS